MATAGYTTECQLEDPDGFYEALIEAHHGLDDRQSMMLNAKLILLLSNQVGDLRVIRAALAQARLRTVLADDESGPQAMA